jgi:hypothetical protein
MKRILLVSAILVASLNSFSQISLYYQYNNPLPAMGATLTQAHGFGFDGLLQTRCKNFYAGLTSSFSFYGMKREPITIITPDSATLNTHLRISNYFFQIGAAGRYILPLHFDRFQPYIEGKVNGIFFQTELIIEDPEDLSNCEPLQSDLLTKDANIAATLNFGFDFRLSKIHTAFSEESTPSNLYFFMSGGFTIGGKVSYMNVETEPTHFHQQASQQPDKNPYYVDFINTQTQVVHQHHVGYVYTSPVRMMEIKGGIILRF